MNPKCQGSFLFRFQCSLRELQSFPGNNRSSSLPLPALPTSAYNRFFCGGGISLEEIDINTFESKNISNLYFTGELLDVCGICGGYNLGFAFLSGMLAGMSVNND